MPTKTATPLEELQDKLAEAQRRAEAADAALAQLAKKQRKLAPGAYEGDEAAISELADVEAETANLTREAQLAKEASRHYIKLIAEEKERVQAARKDEARAEFEALAHERYRVDSEAEEAMETLLEKLHEIRDIHQQQASIAGNELGDQRIAQNPPDRLQVAWITHRLRHILQLPSSVQFAKPLPELDSYAHEEEA